MATGWEGRRTMNWLSITVEKIGAGYDLEIGKPHVKRSFPHRRLLVKYLSSRFTMPPDEAFELVAPADNGGAVVFSLPILPENIAKL